MSSTVKKILGEASEDLRFDCNARVEVWVTQDDLEFRDDVIAILAEGISVEEKKKKILEVARQIASERLSSVKDVEITADVSVSDINVDRINWGGLLEPEPDTD
jgi:hypothetical protein